MSDNRSLDGTFTGSVREYSHGHSYGYGNFNGGYNNRDENVYRDVTYHANQVSLGEQIREVSTSVEKNGAANSLATEKTGSAGQLATEKVASAIGVQVAKTTADLGIQAEKVGASTNLSIEKTAAATNLAIEKIGAAAQLAAERNSHNIQYSTMIGFKDAQLQASENTALIRKDIAECCCETKELILKEACATRELMHSIDAKNQSIALVDAKNELLALKGRCYPSPCSGNGSR